MNASKLLTGLPGQADATQGEVVLEEFAAKLPIFEVTTQALITGQSHLPDSLKKDMPETALAFSEALSNLCQGIERLTTDSQVETAIALADRLLKQMANLQAAFPRQP